jgi:hypothetical protein
LAIASKLTIWFLAGAVISLLIPAAADSWPHHGLLGMVGMNAYVAFCPGNVMLGSFFSLFTIDPTTMAMAAVLNGALYALLGYGLTFVAASHKWTRPVYALGAFVAWLVLAHVFL